MPNQPVQTKDAVSFEGVNGMIHVHVSLVRNLKIVTAVNKNLYSQVICFYLRNSFRSSRQFFDWNSPVF